jgi:hypothetical protein
MLQVDLRITAIPRSRTSAAQAESAREYTLLKTVRLTPPPRKENVFITGNAHEYFRDLLRQGFDRHHETEQLRRSDNQQNRRGSDGTLLDTIDQVLYGKLLVNKEADNKQILPSWPG